MRFDDSAYPDDWIYPDNWNAPSASAAAATAQPAQSLQPSPAVLNRPALPSDPFDPYWSRIPASSLTQFAWHPPIFPDAFGRYRLAPPAPLDQPPIPFGLLAGLAQDPPAKAPQGLFGPLPNLQSPPADTSQSWTGILGALASGFSDRAAWPAENFANPSWPAPPTPSSIAGYSGPGRDLAGSNSLTAASYVPGLPSYLQPEPIVYRGGSPGVDYLANDTQDRADPTGFASDQSASEATPYAAAYADPASANPCVIPVAADDKLEPHGHKDLEHPELPITDAGETTPPTTLLPTLPVPIVPLFPGALPRAAPSPSQPGGTPPFGSTAPKPVAPGPPNMGGPRPLPSLLPTPPTQAPSPSTSPQVAAPRPSPPGDVPAPEPGAQPASSSVPGAPGPSPGGSGGISTSAQAGIKSSSPKWPIPTEEIAKAKAEGGGRLPAVISAALPKYDGKTTYGILITNEGNIVPLKSARAESFPNYPPSKHVEGKAAIWIREHGSSGGVVYHNNTDGTCGRCNSQIRTLLPERAKLDVVPPDDAIAKNSWARARPTQYVGNSATPKLPPAPPQLDLLDGEQP